MNLPATIHVLADPEALARAAADAVVRVVQEAAVTRGVATIALSGGRTPTRLYQLLARPPHSTRLDFSAVHFFFADERCVGPADPQSNYGQARRLLFEPAGVPPANVHRIRGELGPAAATGDYRRQLEAYFAGQPPVFDLVILGIGRDGHTASLFEDSMQSGAPGEWVLATRAPEGVRDRVTLTLAAINQARQVIFLAQGADKAEAVASVLSGQASVPAAGVAPACGQLIWLLDLAAGRRALS